MTSAALGDENGKEPVCFSDFDVQALWLARAVKRDGIGASGRAPAWPLPALLLPPPGWGGSNRRSQGTGESLRRSHWKARHSRLDDFQRLQRMEGGCVAISSWRKCPIKLRKLLKLQGFTRWPHMVIQAELLGKRDSPTGWDACKSFRETPHPRWGGHFDDAATFEWSVLL